MEGSRLLETLIFLLCLGIGYFVYDTNVRTRRLEREHYALMSVMDSVAKKTDSLVQAQKMVKNTPSKAASIFDQVVSDMEKEYKASKNKPTKPQTKTMTVTSSYRIEDRYVSYKIYNPDCMSGDEGVVIIDIVVNKLGHVITAKLNDGSTITDEDVIEACKKAALKTSFNYKTEAAEKQVGVIKYTFARK